MSKQSLQSAERPVTKENRQYHLQTKPGDIAPHCLLVGAPERAEMIAKQFLTEAKEFGNHRGLRSFTGFYKKLAVSVITTGMGGASTGIVLPEAVRSGARRFIRVGSCGSLRKEADIGHSAIFTGAVRLDGASENWAPIEYPAVADFRIVAALKEAAEKLKVPHHLGINVTTSCFMEGQARPDDNGYIPQRIINQHQELIQCGALAYSMEEATIFVWCLTHGGYWAGAIDAVFANRQTNKFGTEGEEQAAKIALEAIIVLNKKYPLN